MEVANKDTKAKLDDYISSIVKGCISEQFLELRKENEAKVKEMGERMLPKAAPAVTAKGSGFVRIVQSLANSRGDVTKAAAYAKEQQFDEEVIKALSMAPGSAGGYLVPPAISQDVIELLYNQTAVRKLGAISLPMPNGNLTIPKVLTGSTAAYVGENATSNATQGTVGVVQLSMKKLKADVPISNDLLKTSSSRVDALVQNDMVNAFRVAEDAYFLRGTGTGQSPKGIDAWIPTANPDHVIGAASADGSDLTLVINDLYTLPMKLEESNIPFVKPGWVFSPRTKKFLMTVRDSVGGFYFKDEMLRGTLLGYPFVSTNQVPSTISSNQSVIYFGDWNDAIIGEVDGIQIDVSDQAAYVDSTGTLVSAFSLDQTIIRAIARHDFGVRRVESFAKLDTLTWGA